MDEAALPELADRLARLERRLAREVAARLEAETIAERETRALYEQTRRLQLMETVATESNRGNSVEEVLARTLEQVCAFTGWPLSHVYLRDDGAAEPTLRSARLWCARDDQDYAAFRAESEDRLFGLGIGLPGRVLQSGQAAWIPDITKDTNFLRAPVARACGLRAGFCFPVLVGAEVVAVLEFFLDREQQPDEALLRTLDQIGAILGRVFERDRAEAFSRQKNGELEQLVEEAQTQRRAAEAANVAKTSFLAVTSHEVRTPLNAVLGLAEALSRETLSGRQQELVDGIRDSGGMLLRLLNAVLDVAKIESGQIALAANAFDLVAVVKTVARLWGAKAEEMGLVIDLDISTLSGACPIVSDAGKIEQTLVNLLSNAMKFSPRGGTIGVRVSAQEAGEVRRVRVEVLDEGGGVCAADRERIFAPYEQTPEGRDAGGAGLGLAICAANVKVLGGEIGVETREGPGSCFWFAFEAQAAALEQASPAAREPETEAVRDFRILAAEDNLANRQVLRLLLEPIGVVPDFVENGRDAVEAARTAPYDLILMDANMPVMDGIAATRAIRALPPPVNTTPLYMLTANVFDDDRQRYAQAGVDGVIAKPVAVAELYAAIMAAMGAATPDQRAA